MIWGMEVVSRGAILGVYEGQMRRVEKGRGSVPTPIGKPRGNGTPPRAFRSPGVGVTPSIPIFRERKGTEVGTEVKGERK